jgi:hypothetical protein
MRGGAIVKSTEAGTTLETIGDNEKGRNLDRKTVHRALDVARGILRASSEVVRVVAACHAPGVARSLVWCGLGEDNASSIEGD